MSNWNIAAITRARAAVTAASATAHVVQRRDEDHDHDATAVPTGEGIVRAAIRDSNETTACTLCGVARCNGRSPPTLRRSTELSAERRAGVGSAPSVR
jgi:hypothetical protein